MSGQHRRLIANGLLAAHRDVDLHVYSKGITIESSFATAAKIAANPNVVETKCINGLHTDEHCVAWHFLYRYGGELWQFDVIHIEEQTRYDGFFEKMADRIVEVMTPEQRDTILRLKFEAPADADWQGVEYYEAVIADGIADLSGLTRWIEVHRKNPPPLLDSLKLVYVFLGLSFVLQTHVGGGGS